MLLGINYLISRLRVHIGIQIKTSHTAFKINFVFLIYKILLNSLIILTPNQLQKIKKNKVINQDIL